MKIRLLLSLLAAVFLLAGCHSGSTRISRPEQFQSQPLIFQFPAVDRFRTANGIRVFFLEDRELPLVSISAMVDGGSLVDPDGKVGLGALFAATLRSGGAGRYAPDAFDDLLEGMAANLAVATDTYATHFELSLRREDLDKGLALLDDLLRRPLLDRERLDLAKKRMAEAIRRRDDFPRELARDRFRRQVYQGHPLGREPTVASVERVSRSDLVAFHQRHFHPGNLWLAVSGDIGLEELKILLDKTFGDWPAAAFTAAAPVPPPQPPERELLLARRNLPQTTIIMGDLGIDKNAPDLFDALVLDFILGGGGFNSRLMRQIRSDRGLAYSVYSHFQVGRRLPGLFWVGCETRADATVEVIRLIHAIIEDLRENRVSESELRLAQESLINSFVFAFDDRHAVVAREARLDFYDYPADYLRTYRDRIAAVTPEGVLAAARRRLDPQRFTIVLVGDPALFDAGMETLGMPVREIPAAGGAGAK
ncbi:MAG: insulinase family protein [Desulfuromonadaceae bacterium]|nr:insulinase family protein [Desulfuromonadaceae bacterium]